MAAGLVDRADEATADIAGYLNIIGLDGQPAEVAAPDRKVDVESTLSVSASEAASVAEGIYSFMLPEARSGWLGSVYASTTSNTTRPVNLLLPYLADETYTCTLDVHDGLKAVALPENMTLDTPVGSLKVTVAEENGKTVITRSLKLVQQLITPALYPQYYRLMSEWYTLCATPLIFSAE